MDITDYPDFFLVHSRWRSGERYDCDSSARRSNCRSCRYSVGKERRHLARSISGANLIIYPGGGHIPEVERADQFNRDILIFLEAIHGTGGVQSS
jgi:pimeloyl-ACP methyl ester carboxylesterase